MRLRILLVLLAAPLALAGQTTGGGAGPVAVQLLAFNDFHGNLEPPSGDGGLVNQTTAGGAEYLATYLKNAAVQNPNSIVVAAGDLIGASPLISSLFHNEPAIESMNAMNLSIASVGNHEFDRGRRELLRMQRGGCHPTDGCQDGNGFAGARFQYLAANVIDRTASPPRPILPATAVRTVGGVKVGFIGETLKGTPKVVLPSAVRGLTFLDEAITANAHAARLKRQGVNAIVLLIHQGGRQRPADPDADPNGCAGFSGGLDPILGKLSPDIKVVISGHSHRLYNCTIAGRLVTSAGSYGRVITRVNLTIAPSNDVIISATAKNEIVRRDVEKDATQTQLIAKYGALSKPIADRAVGSVTSNIPRRLNSAGESALGDVIADSQLAAARPTIKGGAVVAFMNAGGIRSDLIVDEGGIGSPGGRATYGQLFSVLPFGNVVTVRTMTGNMIRRVLEQQFDNPGPTQQTFLQVSNGFTYRYALNAPAGRHVDARSIKIADRLVGAADRVRVAMNSFLVSGGDNFSVFEEATNGTGGDVDLDALVAYFRTKSPVSPGPQDRIVRTD